MIDTIARIAGTWLLLSVIATIGWALARWLGWIGFSINDEDGTPACLAKNYAGRTWPALCDEPRGHPGPHRDHSMGIAWL